MMKLVVFLAILATSLARSLGPGGDPKDAQILRSESDISPEGSYQYAYETENRIQAQEQGNIQPKGPEEANKSVNGQYSYISPEGEEIHVSYVADENGFQPSGNHLPTSPPIPPEILKSLEYNAAHPEPEEYPKRVGF